MRANVDRACADPSNRIPSSISYVKERYLNIYPYLWLHRRVWFGNRTIYRTILVSKYSTQSGKIEFSRVQLHPPGYRPSDTDNARYYLWDSSYGRLPEYLEAETTIVVEHAMFGLRTKEDPTHYNDRNTEDAYPFHRIVTMPVVRESSSSELAIWPPMAFPAEDRTTINSPLQYTWLGESPSYSCNVFGVRKAATGFDSIARSPFELLSALDPKLYTSDIENPMAIPFYSRIPVRVVSPTQPQSSRRTPNGWGCL